MPLWDSVQRSLEKASQEAARIAKMQRLRSTIDGISRQIHTQNNNLLNKTMDLFAAGQLTQNELLSLCQELTNLQQQLNSTQAELKQIQAQASGQQSQAGAPNPYLPPGPGGPAPSPYPQTADESPTITYAPPPPEYQSYLNSTQGITVAPPPPGAESLTVSAVETLQMSGEIPPGAARRCMICQTELTPQNAFCFNCGAPVQDINSQHSPTMQAGNMEPIYPEGHPTVRGDTAEPANLPGLANTPAPSFPGAEDATARASAPLDPSSPSVTGASPAKAEKDKGV